MRKTQNKRNNQTNKPKPKESLGENEKKRTIQCRKNVQETTRNRKT